MDASIPISNHPPSFLAICNQNRVPLSLMMMAVRVRYWSYDAANIPELGCGDGVRRDGVILVPPTVNLVVGFPRLNAILRQSSRGAFVSSSAHARTGADERGSQFVNPSRQARCPQSDA